MKKITPIICSVLLVLLMCNCTGKFEEFNSNQYQPPVLNSRLLFAQLITCMSSTEENPHSVTSRSGQVRSVVCLLRPAAGAGASTSIPIM